MASTSVDIHRCAFQGCTNNSRLTPPEIRYHPFTKPCLKVSQGKEEATVSHLSQCPTCMKCKRWILIGQGTKKWPKSLKEINRRHYLCSLHFVYGHPHSDRFPDPLPATSILELKNKRKALQENVLPAKKRTALTINVQRLQSKIFTNIESTTAAGIEHTMISPIGSKTCNISTKSSQFSNEHNSSNEYNSTLPNLARKTRNNNMTSRSQQTTFIWKDIQKLKDENKQLLQENITLKKRVFQLEEERNRGGENISQFVKSLEKNDKKCKFYTNLTFVQILAFLNFLSPYENIHYWKEKKNVQRNVTKRSHTFLEELILVLVRLRTGLLTQDLVYRFGISQGFISSIFITWVQHAYCKLDIMRPLMFTSRDIIKKNLPAQFRNMKNIRVIIDCAEFYCQTPSNFEHSGNVYSQYKAHSTLKVLLGCTPNGAVSFVSDLFEGSISDKEIVKQSKLMNSLDKDDLVLADRGFTIKELTDEKNVTLNIPPFLHGRSRLTPEEEIATKLIAKHRIYVEHVVGKLKQFRLLRKILPQNMRGILSQTVFVCACLINYQEPILKPKEQ